jgi:hypothetical protein
VTVELRVSLGLSLGLECDPVAYIRTDTKEHQFREISMPLTDLNAAERNIVKECLRAAVDGPFFPDWEFHSLFGLERAEVKKVLQSWPELNEADETVAVAINNSFNNLLGYPDDKKLWPKFLSVTRSEVARIFDKWKDR